MKYGTKSKNKKKRRERKRKEKKIYEAAGKIIGKEENRNARVGFMKNVK